MAEDQYPWKQAKPYYRQIYEYLADRISSGELAAGERIPSEKDLCAQFGVSRITSKKALDLLSERGLVERYPGKGSFVTGNAATGSRLSLPSRTISLLIPDFGDTFGTSLVYGIEETCAALRYHLILKRTRDVLADEEAALRELIEAGIAGILVLPVHGEFYNPELVKLTLKKFPLVFVDRNLRGLAVPSVATDNVAAAAEGVGYLIDLGHSAIGFYSGPTEHTSTVEDRKQGFTQAFGANGIPLDPQLFCPKLSSAWSCPVSGRAEVERDIETVRAHLSSRPDISAAFVTEYALALIVRSAALSLGRRIPEDLSVLCFDAPRPFVDPPPFTYVMQDEREIGKRAVEALHGLINGGDPAAVGDIRIPAKLVLGVSTAKKI